MFTLAVMLLWSQGVSAYTTTDDQLHTDADLHPSCESFRDTPQRCTVDRRAAFSEPLSSWWGDGLAIKLVVEGRFEVEGSAYRWELDSPSSARLELLQPTVDSLGLGQSEEIATPLGEVTLEYPEGRPHCTWRRSKPWTFPRGLPGLEIVSPDGIPVAIFAFYEDDLIEPVSIVFLVDASGSMQGGPLRAAKAAVIASSENLHSDSEVALIVHYDCDTIRTERPFEKADDEFRRKVEAIDVVGGTPLGDALVIAFEYLHDHSTNPPTRRVLIALTDGAESCGISPEGAIAGWDSELAGAQSFTILGMSLPDAVEVRLKKIAAAAGGSYESVTQETVKVRMKKSVPRRLSPRREESDDK